MLGRCLRVKYLSISVMLIEGWQMLPQYCTFLDLVSAALSPVLETEWRIAEELIRFRSRSPPGHLLTENVLISTSLSILIMIGT